MWEAALQAVGILVAGYETTANMIALSVVALLEQPDQLAIIRDTNDQQVLDTVIRMTESGNRCRRSPINGVVIHRR